MKQKKTNSNTYIRPPLKWPGGKFKLLDRIMKMLTTGDRLVEPFAGSCVVALNSDHDRHLLNDKNGDLINFYKSLKMGKQDFIDFARQFFDVKYNNPDAYYHLRDEFNTTTDSTYKAAILLYINRHGYNGLLRYNASGLLNVPVGRYKKPYFPEKEMLHFLPLVQRASFHNKDFESIMRSAIEGDIIYCDPPYVPLSSSANFTSYSAGGFSLEDQERLVRVAEEVSNNGITVVISNHSTAYTREIYRNAIQARFSVTRTISCDSKNRGKAKELIAYYPAGGVCR